MQTGREDGQMSLFGQDGCAGKTSPAHSAAGRPKVKISALSLRKSSELKTIPYMSLDLTPGHGNLLGESYWEIVSPSPGESSTPNTGPASLNEEDVYSLSQILQDDPPRKYYLSKTACLGILRRARERGKELPPQLKAALMAQAGLARIDAGRDMDVQAYHINQRNEGIDLGGISGALMRTQNMQMQTFVTQPPVAFAANQRDEVRDLHDVAGALGAQPGMKQQTFIAQDCLTPWDTQRTRIFTPESKAPTLTGADGGGGRNPAGLLFAAGVVSKGDGDCFLTPERHTSLSSGGGQAGQGYPCILTGRLRPGGPNGSEQKARSAAGFCAGAGAKAGSIGYQEEVAPTLKAGQSGSMMPTVFCLNDQGGQRMDLTTDMTPTLRAQMGGHQPLICLNDQGGGVMDCSENVAGTLRVQENGHQPLVFENHGVDARYRGPLPIAPTLPARAGTGGNNLSLVLQEPEASCASGNVLDRHATYSRQWVDVFKDSDVASTESARQQKDATDLICQKTVGSLASSHRKDPDSQYMGQDKSAMDMPLLIRRLTPLECERLQGFPDFWTDLPGASDSSRYRALGNSVAIPCVEYIMRGISLVLRAGL